MEYLILNDKAMAFTRELFKMTKPVNQPDDITLYQYGWITHTDGRIAIAVDLDEYLGVHPQADVEPLVLAFYPNVNNNKMNQIKDFIATKSSIQVREILSNYVTIYTYAQMEADGWFPMPTLN